MRNCTKTNQQSGWQPRGLGLYIEECTCASQPTIDTRTTWGAILETFRQPTTSKTTPGTRDQAPYCSLGPLNQKRYES